MDDLQLRYLFGLLAQGFPAPQVNAAIAALDWIDNLPLTPVRISRIGKHRALTADFRIIYLTKQEVFDVVSGDDGEVGLRVGITKQKSIKSKNIMIFRESIPQKSLFFGNTFRKNHNNSGI